MHLHQNEDEHLVILTGAYRIACEDKVVDASVGSSLTTPKGACLAKHIRPPQPNARRADAGWFEKLIHEIIHAPADKVEEIAARYGCIIVGPPLGV